MDTRPPGEHLKWYEFNSWYPTPSGVIPATGRCEMAM
jgi:hypothetical protein